MSKPAWMRNTLVAAALLSVLAAPAHSAQDRTLQLAIGDEPTEGFDPMLGWSHGSYLLLQKYRHDLHKWAKITEEQQANVIGRSKHSNEELPSEQRLPTSHLGRVDLKENGQGLKIIRQSLPYGNASGEQGLMFIAYCARLRNIEQQLLSMFGELDGKTDLLLSKISTAISGSYYFVPSQERLADL